MCRSCYYSKTDVGVASTKRARAAYIARNPGWAKRLWLTQRTKKYGITPDEYRDMVVGQAGRCLICQLVPKDDLCIDHDHLTGRVRGLLCKACNLAIGSLRDRADLARSAARYLDAA